jgi:hypothetical protein
MLFSGSGSSRPIRAMCQSNPADPINVMAPSSASRSPHSGTRHYLTSQSAAQAPPPRLALLVRGHWSVENNLHWLRDAVWNEDACRTHDRNTACALALLRRAGHRSPQQAVETFAHTPHLALQIILRQRLA